MVSKLRMLIMQTVDFLTITEKKHHYNRHEKTVNIHANFFKNSHKKYNSHIRDSMLYFLNVINLDVRYFASTRIVTYFYIFTFEINTQFA